MVSNIDKKPMVNPMVVLREEFDDWAILFDPDTSNVFSLNPVSLFIWKHLDGSHTVGDIIKKVAKHCEDVPEVVDSDVENFIEHLIDHGLAGYEVKRD